MSNSSSAKTSQPHHMPQEEHKRTYEKETMTLSEAASIMRNENASPEERSRAASIMGREGGKHSHDHDREERSRKKAAGA